MNPSAHRRPLRALARPEIGGVVQGAAALLWLAALLAGAVQALADGGGLAAVLWPALGILLFGWLRAACEAWGARRTFGRARARLSDLRAQAAEALAGASPLDRGRVPSGLAAPNKWQTPVFSR